MDFAQRGVQQSTGASVAPAAGGRKKREGGSWTKLTAMVMLVAGGVLLVALILFVVTGSTDAESKFVSGDKYQAVFLNGGQVYFGQVKDLNTKYLRLQDIYYLRVNQTVQPNQTSSSQNATTNDVSLVKLGCELHGPQDEMLINREQIIFWENLKTDGQVAKAVSDYKKQNPNGQKCETTTNTTTDTTKKP